MKTPAGKECKYYFADYYRGREKEECRLIDRNPDGGRWRSSLCRGCPVPDILSQNACPNLILEARVHKSMLGLREQVKVFAVCSKFVIEVEAPAVGCGHCHEELENIRVATPP
jgi:hypothetical protein